MREVLIDVEQKTVLAPGGGHLTILGRIQIEVEAGTFLSLVGPSGAGKTTLLRIVAGLDDEYQGEVTVGGRRVAGPGRDRGMVFQEARLMPWMTVEDNVAFALPRSERRDARKRIEEVLALVHLTSFAKAWPRQLSGGMVQRASLARALVNVPDVLLLDEPLAALDSLTRIELQRELEEITLATGLTAMMVTHDIDEALALGDCVLVLSGRPATVLRRIDIDLPRPRSRTSPEFFELRSRIFDLLEHQGAGSATA